MQGARAVSAILGALFQQPVLIWIWAENWCRNMSCPSRCNNNSFEMGLSVLTVCVRLLQHSTKQAGKATTPPREKSA